MKQTKSTKTVAANIVVKKVVLKQLSNKKFGTVTVVKTEDDEGFACLDDLCDILNLFKKEVIEKLDGHLYTVSPKKTEVTKYDTDYVDEVGIYLLYFLSKENIPFKYRIGWTRSSSSRCMSSTVTIQLQIMTRLSLMWTFNVRCCATWPPLTM